MRLLLQSGSPRSRVQQPASFLLVGLPQVVNDIDLTELLRSGYYAWMQGPAFGRRSVWSR